MCINKITTAIAKYRYPYKINGAIYFENVKNKPCVNIHFNIKGLTPNSINNLYVFDIKNSFKIIHDYDHIKQYGSLGNLYADDNGEAIYKTRDQLLYLNDIIGKYLIIYPNFDACMQQQLLCTFDNYYSCVQTTTPGNKHNFGVAVITEHK